MAKERVINVIANRNYESRKVEGEVQQKLENHGFKVTKEFNHDAEATICIGGDGAFLRAVHRNNFPTTPFIGINTGHLGFYQEVIPSQIDEFIDNYMRGCYEIIPMSLIEAKVVTKEKTITLKAINEFVVREQGSKVIHLDIFVDNNHLEKFCGDGIILSTPHGSTGYNFSAGGSIVHPRVEAIQINPIAPINSRAYRSLTNSIIIPGDWEVSVVPEPRYANSTNLVQDGTSIFYKNVYKVNFTVSEQKIYKISFCSNTYWENLKSKFL